MVTKALDWPVSLRGLNLTRCFFLHTLPVPSSKELFRLGCTTRHGSGKLFLWERLSHQIRWLALCRSLIQ